MSTPVLSGSAESDTESLREIARDAYIYGFPMVDNARVQYAYFVNRDDPEFKADWNHLFNIPRVFTPEDKAIQTPNSDTPYSWIGLDLRVEPIVFTVPPIEEGRYWSLQLIDLYTHNFAYLGSRTTGNQGGSYLIAGPGWQADTPVGISAVIHCETEIASAQFRTQLYNPGDLDNVKSIQQQYLVQPLSAFLRQPVPPQAPVIAFPKPLSPEEQKTSPTFFNLLNFYLQFAPVHPSEVDLRARFERMSVGAGLKFDAEHLAPDARQAIEAGMADAWREAERQKQRVVSGEIGSGDLFGTREYLANNYTYRMLAAALGIYGNSREEAMYPAYYADADGRPLQGAHRYVLRFGPGQLPPVNAFWSLTMYEQPSSLLVANPIDRYLLNSTQLDQFVRDADGGITLRIQHESPGVELEPNWLPAPAGAFSLIMRLYWPQQAALDGTWVPPAVQWAE